MFDLETFDFSQVREYTNNPRFISKDDYSKLDSLMRDLGDLSGIVIDVNSGEIVGGNQRNKIIGVTTNLSEIEWAVEYDEPTGSGTLKLGYVTLQTTGEKFNIRLVSWTEKQCEIANLAANYAGGSTDFDKLLGGHFHRDNLAHVFSDQRLENMFERKSVSELREQLAQLQAQVNGESKPSMKINAGASQGYTDNEVPEYDDQDEVGTSQVRMMQLYLNVETQEQVSVWESELRGFLGTDNFTDTIFLAIKAAYENRNKLFKKPKTKNSESVEV